MKVSLNRFFICIGSSKQSFHQRLKRSLDQSEVEAQIVRLMHQVRRDHPLMSLRTMYYKLMPSKIGRDSFEALGRIYGLEAPRLRSFTRTTDSSGVIRFPNLLQGFELNKINQVWVSDITYIELKSEGKFYYLTFIMDAYSNFIVGNSVSDSLRTLDTTFIALKSAMVFRPLIGVIIFHSDGGGQYYCKEFLELTKAMKLVNSMGISAYENPQAERLNGIMKNQYIIPKDPANYQELKSVVKQAVNLYNYERPMPTKQYLTAAQIYLGESA